MSDISNKLVQTKRARRQWRVRSKIQGTSERPRLRVSISNAHITAQLIDDINRTTVASATSVGKKSATGTMTEKAVWVGKEIAKAAKSKNISRVTFDRGHRLYHGRIKALAEAARESGLEF